MADNIIKQAVILAGGLGTRMCNAEDLSSLNEKEKKLVGKGLKGMIQSADSRPIFDSCIQNMIDAGINKIIFVVNSIGGELLKQIYSDKMGDKAVVEYALQPEPLGTANAVLAAEKNVGDEPFLLLHYDNVFSVEAFKILISTIKDADWGAVGFDRNALENPKLSNLRKDKVRQCAVMKVDKNFNLIQIVEAAGEKQDEYVSPNGKILISMAFFAFDKDIFEMCRKIEPRERKPGKKEFELPDAVQMGIDKLGKKLKVPYLYAGVIDLTCIEDIELARELTKNRKLEF